MSAAPTTRIRPPGSVTAAVVLLSLLGVTALPSGALMLVFGSRMFPAELLDGVPLVHGYLAPGLTLFVGFGLGSLVTAYGVARRPRWSWMRWLEARSGRHWSWLALLLLGVGQGVWIGLEYAYLDETSFLQPTYGLVAVGLVALAMTGSVRRWLRTP